MPAGVRLRRTILAMAQRRQRRGTGSAHQFLTTRTQHMRFPDLTPLLHPVPWAVVGAAATRLYMPERMTQDFDILVRAADAATVRQQLSAAGCRYIGDLAIGGSSWTTPDGWSLDVLEGTAPWCTRAIAEAQQNRDAQGLPVVPLPYLVLMKFQAGRVQDLADITRILAQADEPNLAVVRQLFATLLPEDVADLESLIALGQLEMPAPPDAEDDRSSDAKGDS